jgi:hypothetical protein
MDESRDWVCPIPAASVAEFALALVAPFLALR